MFPIGQHVSKLSGYAPALPTPFHADGSFDAPTFERYCDRQILEGANALVVCGTTGEAPTLTPAEHHKIVSIAARVSQCRVPVIAGAGSNSTSHAISLTKDAEAAGADAILSTVPYYNKPTQAGLYAHFRAIAEATPLPIILYDVPSRSACGLSDETVARLAEMPQIIGLKDATGDVTRLARLRPLVGEHFRLLSGDDATALAFFTQGGNGCISVTSNIAPGLCRGMFLACRQGQISRAQRLGEPVARLTAMLFRESNPTPLKYALSLLGLMSSAVRLPLVQPNEDTQAEIRVALSQLCDGYQEQMIAKYEDDLADIRRRA
jgi:4-hydroxy-tetrahydrodipicolinate synthase